MDADPSFEETVEYCFEYGPKCYQKTSKVAGVLVKIFIVITQLGFCCVFFVFVAESFGDVVREYAKDVHLSNEVYILCMYVVMMFVCLIPFIKFLTPISLAGTVFLFVGIITILVISSKDLPSPSTRNAFASATSYPLFFGTVVYAFEGIALIIPLRAEMKKPQKFESTFGVYNVGMTIVVILFNLVGFIGYLRYGEDVQGSLSFNLPHSILSDVIKIIVALGIMFSYPLQFFVASSIMCDAILNSCKSELSHRKKLLVSSIIRGTLVTLTCLVAIFVPKLSVFISLIGSVSSTALALVFPVLCHISLFLCPYEFEPARSKHLPILFTLDSIALILALLGFVTGTYFSIKEIASDFSIHVMENLHNDHSQVIQNVNH